MRLLGRTVRTRLLVGAAATIIACTTGIANAQSREPITIAPQPLESALYDFGGKTGLQVLFEPGLAAKKKTSGVTGETDVQLAMSELLEGTGLTYRRDGDMFVIVQGGSGDPQADSAAGGGATVEALIVTAQKREEAIQDVPIAISAFSQKQLEEQKIEGGFDLLKAIPNVTFSKNNFTSYNFSIRGVGTKAISATTDPGVSVSFNSTGLIQNRLFEQEYFDVERVEVLRGPQGTLYGRNATSGVINVISAKPKLYEFEASLKAEVGNYDARRLVGMVNIPIIEDKLAVRLAGSATQRSGYDYNSVTGNDVNGRDLWSGRLTIGFEPFSRLHGDLIWEHFEEDDNRSRTGKQLCHRDPGKNVVGDTIVAQNADAPYFTVLAPALFSQGCLPGSLYEDAAFGTPNGLALPFVFAPLATQLPGPPISIGRLGGDYTSMIQLRDPYDGQMQSRDLRTIASFLDPVYRAKADVVELNLDFDITDSLTFTSQTAYNKDEVYSFQDFNRFNTVPVFTDTSELTTVNYGDWRNLAPRPEGSPLGTGGVFCDPQLGCSDTIAGFDISDAYGEQFSQELRLQSSFDGPINFSLGANYTEFDTLINYYVFYNLITMLAETEPFFRPTDGIFDLSKCRSLLYTGSPISHDDDNMLPCPYIDPNPVESINGEGHNYFRSKNPYELTSWAGFGELYWNINDALKLTAGLRYTEDEKIFTPVPSQVLLAAGGAAGGTVSRGYPENPPIVQKWGEWTGRLGLDWKTKFSFTDESLLYAFYSRGYKGGGANPPKPGFATGAETLASGYCSIFCFGGLPVLQLNAVEYGDTFEPEFVDAFEIGSKNTLLNGAATLNITAFYYDYKDYQISQIRDRTAVNENFDAEIWGIEFESTFLPSRDFQIIANLGYLDTVVGDGETSIDIMNRTQGDPSYTLVKPWVQLPSNCVVPTHVVEDWLVNHTTAALFSFWGLCGGTGGYFSVNNNLAPKDSAFGYQRYDFNNYPEINGGAGKLADLSGNELPNAPHWTTNIGVQYGRDVGDWRATLRTDAYWQSQSYHRIYNAEPYDKLRGWYNLNLSLWFEQPDWGVHVELYAKNILDHTPITDAFLNSDDTALTTNVFVLDPRLVGLNVRKTF